MSEPSNGFSPQRIARIGGVLYLIVIVIGLCGEMFVRDRLVVGGDPAATAERILGSELLWRASAAAELVMHLCVAGLAVVFWALFRRVHRELALLVVVLNVVSSAIEVGSKLRLFEALFLVQDKAYLAAVDLAERQALAYLSIRMAGHGFAISLLFFGVECVVLGYLICKSRLIPKWIGVLMQVAGACYLANSLTLFVFPAAQAWIYPLVLVPCFVAELSLCLRLLFRGVDLTRWPGVTGSESGGAPLTVH